MTKNRAKIDREVLNRREVGKNMKYMNNHFGQSRIFGNARLKIPMNLQFFADSVDGGGSGGGTDDSSDGGSEEGSGEEIPTVEELLSQLAEERAKSAKLQNEKDTASSEAANYKKQLRARMSANEQEEAEKKARAEALEQEVQQLRNESRINRYSKRFMGIGMDEQSATELAGLTGEIAEPDKFFSALDKFVKATIKKAGEDSVEALIKSNPSINAGNGDGGSESLAVRKAKELAGGIKTVNQDILKNYL